MKNNVILIGYMGCGKSTIGKNLSYKLKMALIDTDKSIENRQKRTISAIFDEDGEEAFRQMETDYLREVLTYKDPYVISVGGGLPMREVNQELMQDLGVVVYLRAKPETIYQRLKHDTTRPLLRGDNPEQKIRDMIAYRGPIYEKAAQVIIDVEGKDVDSLAREIKTVYEQHKKAQKEKKG